VYFVRDLVTEVADHPEVRDLLIGETMDIARSEPLARELHQMPAETLVRWLIEWREEPFTQVDRQLCVAYPPHVIGPERLPVLLRRKGQAQLREMPRVFAALAECGLPMEPIFCGGTKRAMQEREQWASGCNFLALRPGAVASYARNEATLREMERPGFTIGSGDALLTGQHRIADDERAVITFQGSELVRGGGGPRCMTWPIERDDAWG